MKQVIQNFKSGELYVDEVPAPALSKGMVLVETKYSLISAGTERSTVQVAKANLLGKARQRPDLVAQVIQNVKKEGLKATLDKVRTKLDSLKALGYSIAGQVTASMDSAQAFKPGDRVACAGQDYASHAEMVSIPQNLVVKIPDNVSYEEASFTTLGAIAMQGIRQADLLLGESVCVIGLGLLGQISCQLASANGCKVLGIDISASLIQLAKENGADEAIQRDDQDLLHRINRFTGGHGFDKVIITAATASNDPVVLSTEILRKKGQIIVVGAVKMDVPRDPHFYRKELELKISCSYGPGRYDPAYEEGGQDYPYAYVRWTEQRNMEAFLQLVAQKKINLTSLITHRFDISEAGKAYDIVMGNVKEPHIGILLSYPDNETKYRNFLPVNNHPLKDINIGFIGAGSFAQSYLLPHLKKDNISLDTVVTSKGITANNVAQKFGFNAAASDSLQVAGNNHINTVFIATPHNTHASLTLQMLEAGKSVFVEKPLAMNEEELEAIHQLMEEKDGRLMVGFNRRFSPVATALKQYFDNDSTPVVMNYRINAGFIPNEHWIQDEQIGGGRIIGEVCHFIDLMQYFSGSQPVSVYARCIQSDNTQMKNADNITIQLSFANGSTGVIVYVADGDKSMPKERFEIFGNGKAGTINDFKDGDIFMNNKPKKIKMSGKGHQQEVAAFIDALTAGKPMPITFESIYTTTKTTFKIIESLHTGLPQKL